MLGLSLAENDLIKSYLEISVKVAGTNKSKESRRTLARIQGAPKEAYCP